MSKITLTNGQNVDIGYDTEQVTYKTQEKYFGLPAYYDTNTEEVGFANNHPVLMEKTHEVTTHRLSEINFPNGKIVFEKGEERLDLSGSFQIPSIKLYSFDGSTYNLIDNYELSFEYVYNYNSEIDGQDCYRMYLMGIQQKNNGIAIPYEFEYYNKALLPNNKSKEVDVWGYFNDNNAVENAFPKLYVYPALEGNKRFRVYPLNNYGGSEIVLNGADRMADATVVNYGSLKKVTYPTGGASEYIYESNSYNEDGQNIYGGGIRIKEIHKLDELGNIKLKKEFKYNVPGNETLSSGKLFHRPELVFPTVSRILVYLNGGSGVYFYPQSTPPDSKLWYNLFLARSENDLSNVELTKGGYIGYAFVTVSEDGNGKIVNEYSVGGGYYAADDGFYKKHEPTFTNDDGCNEPVIVPVNIDETYHTYPFLPSVNYNWNRGLLLEQSIYDETGAMKKSTDYEYILFQEQGITNYINGIGAGSLLGCGCGLYGYYDILTNVKKLVEKVTEKVYFGGNSVLVEKISAYNDLGQLASITRGQSNGDMIKVCYKYPSDFTYRIQPTNSNYEALALMVINNIINKPIEVVKYNDNKVIEASVIKHKKANNIFVVDSVLSLSINTPITDYVSLQPLHFNVFRDSRMEMEAVHKNYDIYGNVMELKSRNDLTTTYTWDYNGQYPTSKTIIGGTGSLTESWLWEPMVGMTSYTDQAGLITTYEYDDFRRLKLVRDTNGKILKKYEYHYKE